MRYISTRGQAPHLDFAQTTLAGLASDGGLYVPEHLPVINTSALEKADYQTTATAVMSPLIGHSLSQDLAKLIANAYRVFPATPAPVRQINDRLCLLELFHGPTLAFKDFALQFLAQVFDDLLAQSNTTITIVGATSGDTGSAAIEAIKNCTRARIAILHPHTRVSEVQRRQMTTVTTPNVLNLAVDGSFDDCQDLVKAMFNDAVFRQEMSLSAINSINWTRILAQIVYYARASLDVQRATGRTPSFCVPTGNFGNIYAGYLAKKLGFPINRLIVASNRNDILYRYITSGVMRRAAVVPSLSPSMDIQISSNFERLLFDLAGRDADYVRLMLDSFRQHGQFQSPREIMARLNEHFAAGRCDDDETLREMHNSFRDQNLLLDPHTAVGLHVARQHSDDVIVTLATAHPAKFPDAVKRATGLVPPSPPQLDGLWQKPERYETIANDLAALQKRLRAPWTA